MSQGGCEPQRQSIWSVFLKEMEHLRGLSQEARNAAYALRGTIIPPSPATQSGEQPKVPGDDFTNRFHAIASDIALDLKETRGIIAEIS